MQCRWWISHVSLKSLFEISFSKQCFRFGQNLVPKLISLQRTKLAPFSLALDFWICAGLWIYCISDNPPNEAFLDIVSNSLFFNFFLRSMPVVFVTVYKKKHCLSFAEDHRSEIHTSRESLELRRLPHSGPHQLLGYNHRAAYSHQLLGRFAR